MKKTTKKTDGGHPSPTYINKIEADYIRSMIQKDIETSFDNEDLIYNALVGKFRQNLLDKMNRIIGREEL